MIEQARCPQCDAEIPPGAPAGLCPKCLFQAGLDSQQPVAPQFPPTQPSPPPARGFVPPAPEELAARFPQLEILALLGRGGMGAVYKAKQRGLDRLVALKILPPEVSSDPAFAERFTREARALAKLTHSNIVTVYDFGMTGSGIRENSEDVSEFSRIPLRDGLFYFLMEYVDGVNLRQAIQAGDMTPQDALAIVPQICQALQFAHDEGIVHRDIKPENILIDKRGRVKIADFGLAKLLGQDASDHSLTATHQVMGTLRYMAPEQMQGSREVDHRADIYSLGVVFYELLTGELPMGKFAPPSKRVQVDVRLDEIVLRALEQEPEQRYQHASEVKTDVDAISRDRQPPNLNAQKLAHQDGRTARAEPVSLPFEIAESVHWGLFGEVHGKLRLGKNELIVEFEVRSLFPAFRSGLKEVSIPFDDIDSVNWDGWDLTLRTRTMKALAEIPKSSQGQVAFDFSMTDLDVPGGISKPMKHFLACLPSRLVGQSASVTRPESAKGVAGEKTGAGPISLPAGRRPNFGELAMGGIMLVLGLVLLACSTIPGAGVLQWVGLGIALGGGGCFAAAWQEDQRLPPGFAPNPGMLAMGGVMLLVGIVLLLIVASYHHFAPPSALAWTAIGIILGSGGCFVAAWHDENEDEDDTDETEAPEQRYQPARKVSKNTRTGQDSLPPAASHLQRPKLVPVLATFNLVGAIVLMLVCAMEEPAAFARSVPRLWQVWETVDAVLGFSMAAGMFAASIGLYLWKPWARKLTLGVCVFGLASFVFDAPYLARFAIPDFYTEIQQTMIAEGVDPDLRDFAALITVVCLVGGMMLFGLICLIGQLVYFTRPRVVAAFESQGEKHGKFIEWLFSGVGAVVGVLSVFGPLALLLGVTALFNAGGGARTVDSTVDHADDMRIQGTWNYVTSMRDGQVTELEEFQRWQVNFTQAEYTEQPADRFEKGTYKLDPTKTPKTIDCLLSEGPYKGLAVAGIYELDGDTLKICWSRRGSLEHPTEFEAAPDSQRALAVLKRDSPVP